MKGLYHWINGQNYGKHWTHEKVKGGKATISNSAHFWNLQGKSYSLLFLKEGFAKCNSDLGLSPGSVYQMLITVPEQEGIPAHSEIIWINPSWVTPMKKAKFSDE
jgi:hypothetical protein